MWQASPSKVIPQLHQYDNHQLIEAFLRCAHKMKASQASFLLSIASAWAAPATQPQASGAVNTVPGSSGDLRPAPELVGYASSNRIPTSPSTEIPTDEFELAPGQSEDKELGVFIDLSKVENPQPIRGGNTGPTDPGPRLVVVQMI